MAESRSHKDAKSRAAGEEEVRLRDGRRLDSASSRRATEVERSGTGAGLKAAAARLRDSRRPQKVLQVPQPDMGKAAAAMRDVRVRGTVKNLSGTKRRSV